MRLLDKKSIQVAQANDRKLEIDEGLKVARKVDALRVTFSEEESRLNKFRAETVPRVQSEIDEYIEKRDILVSEIKALEEKRLELQKPLDHEWSKLNQENMKLEHIKVELEYKEKQLSELETSLALSMKDMKIEESRIEGERLIITQEHDEVLRMKSEASVELETALQDKEKILTVLHTREDLITSREAEVAVREREVSMVDKSLKTRERALTKKEREINDKYETLQRTLKRKK